MRAVLIAFVHCQVLGPRFTELATCLSRCCVVAAVSNGRIVGRRCSSTMTTTDQRHSDSDMKPQRTDVDGVPAQLVISIPLISWASTTPNPRRRTVCVAPSAQQFHPPPSHSDRDHPRRTSKSPCPDREPSRGRSHFEPRGYNYDRSWYDGLEQID